MKTFIISWIDVVAIVSQFFDFQIGIFKNTTKAQLLSIIKKEEGIFRSRMRPYYGNDLSSDNHIGTRVLLTNRDLEFTFRNSSIEFINPGTQTYKITFTSSTEFQVKPDFDPIVTGNISTDTTLTDLKILSSAWTGYEFNPNDIIYLTSYYHEDALIDVVSKVCAAKSIEEVFTSEAPNISPNATQLRQQVEDFFKLIINETAGDILQIPKNLRDLNYEGINYSIDKYGNDITEYLED